MFNQVDLDINGEPIEIQLKVDDSGNAFFVEDLVISLILLSWI